MNAAAGASRSVLRRPRPLGRRGLLILFLLASGLAAFVSLDLSLGQLVPRRGGLALLAEFARAALHPALVYEAGPPPGGAPPLLVKALAGAWRTLAFAAAAMSLALFIGVTLGFAGSQSAWFAGPSRTPNGGGRSPAALRAGSYVLVRAFIALLRSVHELLWAVLFLAAFGISEMAAVVAIALPYGGTLAKVFSEMLDEAPRDSAEALAAIGATRPQEFLLGLVPRAGADMAAYSFYRLECAVRSSAILGFFGFPTLGYYLRLAFENLHFREVWTYLYSLLVLVVLLELWSAALRRRIVLR